MSRRQESRRIPEFNSVEEEAEFWDTHDTTEFENEFRPVKVRFAQNLSEGLTIRLDPETLSKLRQKAHEQGIGPSTLIRMWVMEHLRSEEPRSA